MTTDNLEPPVSWHHRYLPSLGLCPNDATAFVELIRYAAERALIYQTPGGAYGVYQESTGAELWLGLEDEGGSFEFSGLTPHFRGMATSPVRVSQEFAHKADSWFEGRVLAVFGDGELEDEECVQVLVDVPNMDLVREQGISNVTSAQLAAYPRTVDVFASEQDFLDATATVGHMPNGKPIRLGSSFFFPLGLFANQGMSPSSYAEFAGTIIAAEKKVSGHSGMAFTWALVETANGIRVDVAGDDSVWLAPPAEGNIIHAHEAWMSAVFDVPLIPWRRG